MNEEFVAKVLKMLSQRKVETVYNYVNTKAVCCLYNKRVMCGFITKTHFQVK